VNARVDFLADLPVAPTRPADAEYRPVVLPAGSRAGHAAAASSMATEADARHLRRLLAIVGGVALALGVLVGSVVAQGTTPRMDQLVSSVGLVVMGLGLLIGRLRVERSNVLRSAVRASAAILVFAAVVTLSGYANVTLALTTLIAVLVAVPYVNRPTLLRLSVAAWAVANLIALSAGLALAGGQPVASQEVLIRVVGVSLQTGIALVVIYHLSGRVTAAAQRYRDLFQRVPVGMYRTTPDGRFLDVNGAFLEMFGFGSPEELTAVDAAELYAEPADRLDFQEAVSQAGVVRSIEYRARHADGGVFWVRDSAMLIRNASGQPVYYEGIVEDVTEHRHHQLKLEHRASVDAVTGLTNRAVLLEMLDASLGAASAERPVALLFVDLDQFKQVNDRYGHASGDEVLVEVGRRLREATREVDTIARYGGDEFVVVLGVPTDEAVAEAVADRVIGEFERAFVLSDGTVSVGASVGVAVAHEPMAAGELIERADRAMYGAKRRSRVLAARD
jgi:diguanylate cyclase (GGDEF)-like protein/PAS domain S-box-containing protein